MPVSRSSASYESKLERSQAEHGPMLKIFAPCSENLQTQADMRVFDESQSADWIPSGLHNSDTEVYSSASPNTNSDSHFEAYGDSLDNNLFWPYDDGAYYGVPPTFIMSPLATDIPSSSTSMTSSRPLIRQDMSQSSMSYEFTNVFDFDFTTSLPHEFPCSSSWTPGLSLSTSSMLHPPAKPSCSPSPSCSSLDAFDAKSTASRESSPSHSENDQHHQRRRFPCLILGCSRRFTSQYTLKVHMEAHKPKPRITFPCTLGCSERFSRQHDRLRHEVAKHGKICEFLCDDCGRFFSTKKTLGNHKCPVAQGGTRWVNS